MRRRLLGLLFALAMAATACATAPPAPTDAVGEAVEATMSEGSARVEIVTAVRRSARQDREQRFRGSGNLDFEQRRAHWVFEPGALPGTNDTELGFQGTIEAINDDLVLYRRAPLPGGAEWLMMDLRARGLTDADGLGGPLHGNDPATPLQLVHGLSDELEEVGRETLRGTPTRRLAGTADLDKAVAETLRTSRHAVERTVAQLGVATLPIQVWIDDQGRVRRLSYEVALDRTLERGHANGAELTGAVRTTLDYFDFGTDVVISPPREGEVVRVDGPFSGFDGFEAERGPEDAEV